MPERCSQSPKGLENLHEVTQEEASLWHLRVSISAARRLPRLGLLLILWALLWDADHLCKQELAFPLDGGSWDGGEGD